MSACVSLVGHNPSAAESARALCAVLVEEAGPQTIYCCARVIWRQKHVRTDADLTEILLPPLLRVAPEHKGTIREIDAALSTLMRAGKQKLVIDFVTKLLSAPDCALALEEFQMFSNALEKSEHLPATLVAWLRSAAPALCSGAVSLHGGDDLAGQIVSLPSEAVAMPANEQAFVCRKAVAYFFFQPVTAASILVSFLRSCDAEAREEITGLLFMPLLQNYGGGPRDYLEGLDDKDPAHAAVVEALAENRRYMEGLTKGDDIRELAPSEHQRLVAHMRQRDEATQTFKAAREQSVLRHFVKNSTILYGRSSLNYFGGAGGRRAVETELQPHSVSMELPRMLVVDPLGLEYLLWRFRNEELEA
ncbi:MAG: hypothetical protein Q8R02_08780 [Hyphomonadaceae bacterium]|nr:hypothetical protein [Hyphomonadaceae bacterium]